MLWVSSRVKNSRSSLAERRRAEGRTIDLVYFFHSPTAARQALQLLCSKYPPTELTGTGVFLCWDGTCYLTASFAPSVLKYGLDVACGCMWQGKKMEITIGSLVDEWHKWALVAIGHDQAVLAALRYAERLAHKLNHRGDSL